MHAGALTGVASLTSTGTVTAATVTDGVAAMNNGAITGLKSLAVTSTVQAQSIIAGAHYFYGINTAGSMRVRGDNSNSTYTFFFEVWSATAGAYVVVAQMGGGPVT